MARRVEEAKNIGPVTGGDLRKVGISTVEALERTGWEEAWILLCQHSPGYVHLVCGYALLGAVEGLDWMKLPSDRKEEVKRMKRQIQRDLRNRA